jgi:hypothetical protein
MVQYLIPLTGSALPAEAPNRTPKDTRMRLYGLKLYMLLGLILIGAGAIIVAASHDPAVHVWEGRN